METFGKEKFVDELDRRLLNKYSQTELADIYDIAKDIMADVLVNDKRLSFYNVFSLSISNKMKPMAFFDGRLIKNIVAKVNISDKVKKRR